MIVPETSAALFPLACLQPVANGRHEWVALALHLDPARQTVDNAAAFGALLVKSDLLEAIGTLQCLVPAPAATQTDDGKMGLLPTDRVILCVPQACCCDPAIQERLTQLHAAGFRIFIDGLPPRGALLPEGVRSLAIDCSAGVPPDAADWLRKLPGPHLAQNVGDAARFEACRDAGFSWFAGEYPLHPGILAVRNEGTSRTRLLKLLGLVARDADSRELETLLKQDPALAYHLLKLVNSAAFALAAPITSFGQAINVLGRRQLQRWLQLLLYAQVQGDGSAHPLLPYAALRASLMEALCQNSGGSKEAQDHAFMIGMFSLLDVLFAMPLDQILASLNLPQEVVDALLQHSGGLGLLLNVVERATGGRTALAQNALSACAIDAEVYWRSIVQAYRWAIQVSQDA
jgi:EAL and modified HD-GYP domain-containing signal transduction protein